MPWKWYGEPVYRYRDEKGKFASQREVWDYSNKSIDFTSDEAAALARRLQAETLTIEAWEKEMRRLILNETMRQYMLGIGGRDQMTDEDYGSVGGMVSEQYKYLRQFAQKISEGKFSSAQIANYSRMYINSTREAFERAGQRTRGLPDMPEYPGSGTSCLGLTNCGCNWEYHFRNGHWECYWTMNPAKENCELCIEHSIEWGPLIIEKQE